jgi:hypothetical protein
MIITKQHPPPQKKWNLVAVWDVRWDRGGTEPAGTYIFFCGMRIDDIKMDLGEIGWFDMDWIDLSQGKD